MTMRRTFAPALKAMVVLEVLTGVKSAAQVCREHSLKDSVFTRWKQEFLHQAPQIFERKNAHCQCEEHIAQLERLVGRLTLELEIAKKASLLLTSPHNGSRS